MLPSFRLIVAAFVAGFLIVSAGLHLFATTRVAQESSPQLATGAASLPVASGGAIDWRRTEPAVPVMFDLRFAINAAKPAPTPAGLTLHAINRATVGRSQLGLAVDPPALPDRDTPAPVTLPVLGVPETQAAPSAAATFAIGPDPIEQALQPPPIEAPVARDVRTETRAELAREPIAQQHAEQPPQSVTALTPRTLEPAPSVAPRPDAAPAPQPEASPTPPPAPIDAVAALAPHDPLGEDTPAALPPETPPDPLDATETSDPPAGEARPHDAQPIEHAAAPTTLARPPKAKPRVHHAKRKAAKPARVAKVAKKRARAVRHARRAASRPYLLDTFQETWPKNTSNAFPQ